MRFKDTCLILFLCALTGRASADKNDRFYVRAYGRFYADSVPYLNKGMELIEKGNWLGARGYFDAAIRIDKTIWPAYIDRALVLEHAGQWGLALQDCDTAAHLRPDFYRTFIMRANIYLHIGRCRDGLTDLNRVISFHGNPETDALALNGRALLRAICRDAVREPKSALADANQACSLDAWSHASYIGTLGIAYAANGDFDDAIRYEQQAINKGKYTDEELRAAQQRIALYRRHQPL